jgi:hypothetical protein
MTKQGLVSNYVLAENRSDVTTTSGHLVSISSGLANETGKQTLRENAVIHYGKFIPTELHLRHETDNCEPLACPSSVAQT